MYPSSDGRDIQFLNLCELDVDGTIQFLLTTEALYIQKEPTIARGLLFICARIVEMRMNFICNGNAYRSRIAEVYLNSLGKEIEVISSGVRADESRAKNVPEVTEYTHEFLKRHGFHVPVHVPTQITQDMLNSGDVLIAMNPIVARNLREKYQVPDTMRVWDIGDFNEQSERMLEEHSEFILRKIKQHVDELARELL